MHFGKVIWKRVEPWQIGTAGLIESFDLRQLNLVILTAAHTDISEWIISHEIMSTFPTAAFLTWQDRGLPFIRAPVSSFVCQENNKAAWETFRFCFRKSFAPTCHIERFNERARVRDGSKLAAPKQVHCTEASPAATPAGRMQEQLYFVSTSLWSLGKVGYKWSNNKCFNTWPTDLPKGSLHVERTFLPPLI